MKKVFYITMILVLTIFITGYMYKEKIISENKVAKGESIDGYVLGTGKVQVEDIGECLLELQMYKGVYYNEQDLGPFYGPNWYGNCKLVLSKDKDIISEYILDDDWQEQMRFRETFEILTYDYDMDGEIEFLIGQYLSSNINEYRLYKVNSHKKITQVEGVNSINISGKDRYSCLLDIGQIGEAYYEYYDNSNGVNIKKKLLFYDGMVKNGTI